MSNKAYFRLDGIKKVLDKLADNNKPGTVNQVEEGRPEKRVSYKLNGKIVFTFGLTRSSRAKEIKYYYVPRQMHLTNKQYRDLHDCPMSKEKYNKKVQDL